MRLSVLSLGVLLLGLGGQPALATTYKIALSGTVNPQFDPNFVGTDYSYSAVLTYQYNPADVINTTPYSISYNDKTGNALETATITIAGLNGGKPFSYSGNDDFNLFAADFTGLTGIGNSQNYTVDFYSPGLVDLNFQLGQNLQTPMIPDSVTTPFSATNVGGTSDFQMDGNTYGDELTVTSLNVSIVSSVPLPASAPMFGAALLALGAVGYRMKRKTAAAA